MWTRKPTCLDRYSGFWMKYASFTACVCLPVDMTGVTDLDLKTNHVYDTEEQ
jgi:hypothetical protein